MSSVHPVVAKAAKGQKGNANSTSFHFKHVNPIDERTIPKTRIQIFLNLPQIVKKGKTTMLSFTDPGFSGFNNNKIV